MKGRFSFLRKIERFMVVKNGEAHFSFHLSGVLELLTSFGLGVDDVKFYCSGGCVVVDCD